MKPSLINHVFTYSRPKQGTLIVVIVIVVYY
jgi:hypothetical protein